MFGELQPISYEEYSSVYKNTGLDVDGRQATLTDMMPCFEYFVINFIDFMKTIPGFKKLTVEDQLLLVRGMDNYFFQKFH